MLCGDILHPRHHIHTYTQCSKNLKNIEIIRNCGIGSKCLRGQYYYTKGASLNDVRSLGGGGVCENLTFSDKGEGGVT